ncbi:transposon Ty3-I Gag-Pol polyprotein [Trichonephila clavipes]|nr:transposon Ty3-I Gag-Pol polyprotein [Trichonephila clavipes]
MALRTIDAAVVQKNSLRVDELLSKLVSLEEQLVFEAKRKVRSSSPHHHQRKVAANQGAATNPQGRYCFYHFRFGKKCLPVADRSAQQEINRWSNKSSIKGEVATIQENNDLSTVNRASKYFNLLKLYPDLTKPNLVNRVVKHEVKHHILTTGQPVYSKARQLAPDKLKLAKQEFQFMLDNDIIRPSKSQWASPLHLVNKKDGTLRPCGDYRRLNAQTIPDRYPIPRIEDFNHILKDKKYFPR